MTRERIRPLLAASAAAAILSYGLLGHALPQLTAHDDMAGATAGLCLLLATVLGAAAIAKSANLHAAVIGVEAPRYAASAPSSPLDGRARASPSVLQRFRN
jgi:hypothetical protein